MSQKHERMVMMKKHLMLKELEIKENDIELFRTNSPTTQSMMNSIQSLGYQTELNDDEID